MAAPIFNPSDGDSVAIPSLAHVCRKVVDGRRAARALGDWTRRFDLSEPEFQVLWCLRDVSEGGADQTAIAHWLAFSPAQVSAIVLRLSTQDWIVLHSLPSDRRRRLWQLSANGRARFISMLLDASGLPQEPDGREAAA